MLESTDWALTRLTNPDPVVRESAVRDALGAVTHQNSIYEVTVPAALYVAAVLDHPTIATGCSPDDANEYEEMRAFRDARPAIFSAVHTLLGHDNAAIRHAALVAAIPLVERPLLTQHQADLARHARRLLATSTDRHHRDRVPDALKARGHDTSSLENASDIAACEHHARLRAARASWEGNWTDDGYSEDPPF
ncbi:hypothetical protein ACWD26_41900 [Streptomyces sp. NPDC002787]